MKAGRGSEPPAPGNPARHHPAPTPSSAVQLLCLSVREAARGACSEGLAIAGPEVRASWHSSAPCLSLPHRALHTRGKEGVLDSWPVVSNKLPLLFLLDSGAWYMGFTSQGHGPDSPPHVVIENVCSRLRVPGFESTRRLSNFGQVIGAPSIVLTFRAVVRVSGEILSTMLGTLGASNNN